MGQVEGPVEGSSRPEVSSRLDQDLEVLITVLLSP